MLALPRAGRRRQLLRAVPSSNSLKHMTQDEFNEIVVNGRTNVNTASENVMPPFGEVEDVVTYLDDIWAYLKARSDGALGRGRPPRIGD